MDLLLDASIKRRLDLRHFRWTAQFVLHPLDHLLFCELVVGDERFGAFKADAAVSAGVVWVAFRIQHVADGSHRVMGGEHKAIAQLMLQRVDLPDVGGHGVNAVRDPKLMEYLVKHGIGIESCPTSNLHTSTVADYAAHPFTTFLDAGVLIGLNTDDPGVSNIDINHEYRIAKSELGLTEQQLVQVQRNGVDMAFLSDSERKALYASKL